VNSAWKRDPVPTTLEHVHSRTPALHSSQQELHNLLKEEKLAGATLLIFANKQDLPDALSAEEIEKVPYIITLSPPNHSYSLRSTDNNADTPPYHPFRFLAYRRSWT
jgi:hypothetical protein